jgi:hypothetical protein
MKVPHIDPSVCESHLLYSWQQDIKHTAIQHNDIQHNDTQRIGLACDTLHI